AAVIRSPRPGVNVVRPGAGVQSGDFSRRRLLRASALFAALPLLEACAPTVPSASPTRPPVVPTNAATQNAVYPAYAPITNGPKPEYPAAGPQYDDAFGSYPANPFEAMPGDPPGTGGTVKIMSIQLFPPPSPLEQNPAWQAVNKALNANVQFEIVTSADYPVKL